MKVFLKIKWRIHWEIVHYEDCETKKINVLNYNCDDEIIASDQTTLVFDSKLKLLIHFQFVYCNVDSQIQYLNFHREPYFEKKKGDNKLHPLNK